MDETEAKQVLRQLKDYQRRVTASPAAALQALQKAGLVTKSGNPTPPYAANCRLRLRSTSRMK